MLSGPVKRRGESRAAVEVTRVPTARIPLPRALGQMGVQSPTDAVLLEPRAVARPFVSSASCEISTSPSLAVSSRASVSAASTGSAPSIRSSSASWQAATDERAVLAVREPQQQSARDPPPGLVEPLIGILGEPSDRPAHAAARRVALSAQHAPVTRPPQLEQHR